MRIALVGDMHVLETAGLPWSALFGKRGLAVANARFNRARRFDPGLLEPLVERIASAEPDWLVFTGDWSTTGLETEMERALAPFRPLLERLPAVAVAGNHDRYTRAATRSAVFERIAGRLAPSRFAVPRPLCDGWRLFAVDAARPRVVDSRGAIGREQRAALGASLRSLDPGVGAVIVCHYPPLVRPGRSWPWHHRLADRAALLETLAASSRPLLWLHGHVHEPWDLPLGGRLAHCRLVNAGAPTQVGAQYPRGQGFALVELGPPDAAPRVDRHTPVDGADGPAGEWRIDSSHDAT